MLESRGHRRAERRLRGAAAALCAALVAPAALAEPPATTPGEAAAPAVTVKPAAEAAEVKLRDLRAGVRPVTIALPGDSLSGYDPGQIEGAAEAAKQELLARLGDDQLAALRAYVEAHYPAEELEVLSLRDGLRLATPESAEGLFEAITDFLATLRGLDPLMVKLNLVVVPPEALVELWPAALPRQKTAASAGDTVPLYRGLWDYRVSKAGFKTIESTLNLVDEAGETFACKLYPLQDPQGPYPCVFR